MECFWFLVLDGLVCILVLFMVLGCSNGFSCLSFLDMLLMNFLLLFVVFFGSGWCFDGGVLLCCGGVDGFFSFIFSCSSFILSFLFFCCSCDILFGMFWLCWFWSFGVGVGDLLL